MAVEKINRFVQKSQNPACAPCEQFASGRQPKQPRAAFDQNDAERCFELRDLMAQRRLADGQGLCGTAKPAASLQFHEIDELAQADPPQSLCRRREMGGLSYGVSPGRA